MQEVLFTEQLPEYSQYLETRTLEHIHRRVTESFEGFETFDLMAFNWYDVNTEDTAVSRILIYVDRDDLFFICEDARAHHRCRELLPGGQSNERALYSFFVGLLRGDPARLDQLETQITDAEDAALASGPADYLARIREYRKQLLHLKRYYQQLDVILDNLTANDNGLFTPDGLRLLSIIHNRVEHLSSQVVHLRDYVTQMREACQAQIDLEQNRLMRAFTVITALFLPLSLIAGWYGMNFTHMPELDWRYGYPAVIVLSALVCVILLVWFRRRRWF